jgi:hypothetical protein
LVSRTADDGVETIVATGRQDEVAMRTRRACATLNVRDVAEVSRLRIGESRTRTERQDEAGDPGTRRGHNSLAHVSLLDGLVWGT